MFQVVEHVPLYVGVLLPKTSNGSSVLQDVVTRLQMQFDSASVSSPLPYVLKVVTEGGSGPDDASVALGQATELYRKYGDDLVGWVGPIATDSCMMVQQLAKSLDKLQVSFGCQVDYEGKLRNMQLYPLFARTAPPYSQLAKSLQLIFRRFKWRRTAMIYEANSDGTTQVQQLIVRCACGACHRVCHRVGSGFSIVGATLDGRVAHTVRTVCKWDRGSVDYASCTCTRGAYQHEFMLV